jgi:hypothetical protein
MLPADELRLALRIRDGAAIASFLTRTGGMKCDRAFRP